MKTIKLLPRARQWYDLPVPVAATICIFALLAIASLIGKIHTAPTVAAVPTPALSVIIFATSPAIVVPTVAPVVQVAAMPANALRRAVVAYDAPAGNVLGAIEQGRAYSVLARYGAEWLQADVSGSGVVWLKADQVLDLPADLADLQPTIAPVIVERPVYVASEPAAAPTMAPEQLARAEQPPAALAVLSVLDRQRWAMQAATARTQP